jgi:hypothetical protein
MKRGATLFDSIRLRLEGKKTYIVAIVMAVLNFAVAMNWLSPQHLTAINFVLTALGFTALKAGINREL